MARDLPPRTLKAIMTNCRLICPIPPSTPAEPGLSRSRTRAIPSDLLEEASRRLAIMSLLAAVLWLVATVLDHLALRAMTNGDRAGTTLRRPTQSPECARSLPWGCSSILAGATSNPGSFWILGSCTWSSTASPSVCSCIGTRCRESSHVFPMITWIGAVILMSSAILPNTPSKTLVAGLIAASMNPLGLLIAMARGIQGHGPASNALVMHYPDYLLVGVAVVISHVVTRLGQQVTKAREMGSYRLVTLLGTGGMGEVWRARHRMLARDAAIKLIQPDMLSRGSGKNAVLMRRRFEQEAKATASLRSPHTVELYDFGVTEDGVFYYVMELLDGIDLETLVKRFGPQPPARVVWIVRQVCRSLADAHHHGMIHRDIKPANIFLCRMGNEYDFAKVLDFGLVKVLDGHGTAADR